MKHISYSNFIMSVSIAHFGLLLSDCGFVQVAWFYLVFADLLATQ
jgi:hypothetical protein